MIIKEKVIKYHNVYNISLAEITRAASTLAESFKNDPLLQWFFFDDKNYRKHATTILKTWVKYCVLYGIALRSENFECVAIRRLPGDATFSLWKVLRSGMLKTRLFMGNEGFLRLQQFEQAVEQATSEHFSDQEYLYCWMIGTRPQYQHQGFGSAIMEETFRQAETLGVNCYLEVSSHASMILHREKGYDEIYKIELSDSNITVTGMLRQHI